MHETKDFITIVIDEPIQTVHEKRQRFKLFKMLMIGVAAVCIVGCIYLTNGNDEQMNQRQMLSGKVTITSKQIEDFIWDSTIKDQNYDNRVTIEDTHKVKVFKWHFYDAYKMMPDGIVPRDVVQRENLEKIKANLNERLLALVSENKLPSPERFLRFIFELDVFEVGNTPLFIFKLINNPSLPPTVNRTGQIGIPLEKMAMKKDIPMDTIREILGFMDDPYYFMVGQQKRIFVDLAKEISKNLVQSKHRTILVDKDDMGDADTIYFYTVQSKDIEQIGRKRRVSDEEMHCINQSLVEVFKDNDLRIEYVDLKRQPGLYYYSYRLGDKINKSRSIYRYPIIDYCAQCKFRILETMPKDKGVEEVC